VGEQTEARVRGWRARGEGVLGRGLGGGRGRSQNGLGIFVKT
jgi:hypothetical protein